VPTLIANGFFLPGHLLHRLGSARLPPHAAAEDA
jgi:hypothetical protein